VGQLDTVRDPHSEAVDGMAACSAVAPGVSLIRLLEICSPVLSHVRHRRFKEARATKDFIA